MAFAHTYHRRKQYFVGMLYPDSDVETTGYTSTPLWNKLDEVTPDDATTEVTSTDISAESPATDTYDFEVGIENPVVTPSELETVVVSVRQWLDPAASGSTGTYTFRVKEATTTRATMTGSISTVGYTTYSLTLSASEVESFSNWNNLRVQCEIVAGNTLDFEVSNHKVTSIIVAFS